MESLMKTRAACKLTRREVANQVGVTEVTIFNWENGRSEPRASDILALCKVYGCTADELLGRKRK